MAYTLATAAEAAKVTKPTVFRWIKSGKISATKTDEGTYRIEPAELHRYLDSVKETPLSETVQKVETPPVTGNDTLPEMIALRSEVEKLKALLEAEKQRASEIREDRDRWADQAQRLALPRPETIRNDDARRGWWPFRRSA
jgi:excisionase family DNA binding protein